MLPRWSRRLPRALAFDLPQEDELGTNVLSAGVSPYMPLIFMQQETEYRDYFSFKVTPSSPPSTHRPITAGCVRVRKCGQRSYPLLVHRA